MHKNISIPLPKVTDTALQDGRRGDEHGEDDDGLPIWARAFLRGGVQCTVYLFLLPRLGSRVGSVARCAEQSNGVLKPQSIYKVWHQLAFYRATFIRVCGTVITLKYAFPVHSG